MNRCVSKAKPKFLSSKTRPNSTDMLCDESSFVIPSDGMNFPAEGLAVSAHMHADRNPCKCSPEIIGKECELCSMSSGLVHIRHCGQVTHYIFADPSSLIRLPYPAPPPKLHYSTRWRSIARKMYLTIASSRLKKLKAGVQSDARASQN